MRIIFHLDLDAFFISVERLLDPSLEGKPVIVGADPQGRGVVAACSYEARRFGLHSAMPIRQAAKLCPNGIYLHGHFSEYTHYSGAVKTLLEEHAPLIEQASIDEFYMDFTGCRSMYGSYLSLASFLQEKIYRELGLPCSVGIGTNKTIAKIASDCMKPKGITYVMPGMEKEFLNPMPVETIPGVGKVTLRALNEKGFYKIGDIARASADYFSAAFGENGLDLWNKANGKGTEFLTLSHERKSISKEHTFEENVIDRQLVDRKLFELTGKVCHYLREENWQTATISIKLRYADFTTITRAKTVQPTSDDKAIYDIAHSLLEKAWTRRTGIRLIGIHLTKFSGFAGQETLFVTEEMKRKKMIQAVDLLRGKYGYSSVFIGKS